MTDPIERTCYWLARRGPRGWTPLEGPDEADIVIVGAGLTGLWTAIFLRETAPRTDVMVVEQGLAAHGASGRNAGMLSESVDHGHDLAIRHFGRAEARRLAALGTSNVAEMMAFLRLRDIRCDYEPTGRLMVALTPRQLEDARRTVETAGSLGLDSFRLLDAESTRAEIRCPLYLGAAVDTGGGILDPVMLVEGLRAEAERVGVRIRERSEVVAIERSGAGVAVRTKAGAVSARQVVLATSAYTHRLVPAATRRFLPLYDYILVSDPLTAEQREAIGWRGRQGVTDGRAFFNYYRLTADDRILWGTSEAVYHRGNRVDPSCDHSAAHYDSLRASFRRHFPALSGLEFPYAWGGPICSTTRLTPFFGRAMGGLVCYALGYTGHGLATTRIAGRILAHLALDLPSELLSLSLVRRKPFPFPPEPFRSWSVAAVTRALRRADAGGPRGPLLRVLDWLGIGLSS